MKKNFKQIAGRAGAMLLLLAASFNAAAEQGWQFPINSGTSLTTLNNKNNEGMETLRSNFAGPSAPTDPTPTAGQTWYDSVNGVFSLRVGSVWRTVPFLNGGVADYSVLYWSPAQRIIGVPLTTGQIVYANGSNIPTAGDISNITGTLLTSHGGTGLASYTQGDLLFYDTGTLLSKLAKSTSATRYLSNTGSSNNPAWGQINLANGVTGTLPVGNGGTGATSLTDGGILIGGGAGAFTALGVGTNGQIPIGDGTTAPVLGTITAGAGIAVDNGAGSITVRSTTAPIKFNIPASTVAAGSSGVGSAVTINIAIPARGFLKSGSVKVAAQFTGLAQPVIVSSIVGAFPLVAGYNANTAADDTNFQSFGDPIAPGGVGLNLCGSFAGWNLEIVFTPDAGEDLADLSGGSVDVFYEYSVMPA